MEQTKSETKNFLQNIPKEVSPELVFQGVGGSHLYGLNNENSDIDWRIVYKTTNPVYIYGLRENKAYCGTSETEDFASYELRHFMRLMAKSNTQVAEIMFCDENSMVFCGETFKIIRENRFKLLDSEQLYNSLRGYLHNERRLTLGERMGQLGGKRKACIDERGFSHKNAVQFIRLCVVGAELFLKGDYTVSMKGHLLYDLLMEIKTNPNNFTKEKLANLLDEYEKAFMVAYENRKFNFSFDYKLAGEILRNAYA